MRRDSKILCPEYLEFIRQHPCIVCGCDTVDAHHLKARGRGAAQQNDFTAAPLCREHHTEIHMSGLIKFGAVHAVNVWEEAFWLMAEFAAEFEKFYSLKVTQGKI